MEKKFKKSSGISLVALVTSILILLILAVVGIVAINEHDLFAHADNAGNSYQTGKQEEANRLDSYVGFLDGPQKTKTSWTQNADGTITDGLVTLKIGDYVEYDPTDGATTTSVTSLKEKTGHSKDQTFQLSSYTGRMESIRCKRWKT